MMIKAELIEGCEELPVHLSTLYVHVHVHILWTEIFLDALEPLVVMTGGISCFRLSFSTLGCVLDGVAYPGSDR